MAISRAFAIEFVDLLSPGERAEFDSAFLHLWKDAPPLNGLWYEASKDLLNPDAVRYIDNLLAQSG